MKSSATEHFSPLVISLVVMLAIVGTIFVGCVDDQIPTGAVSEPEPPQLVRFDGTHEEGNPGFFLLPPVAANPVGSENYDQHGFNAFVEPWVEICQLVWVASEDDLDVDTACDTDQPWSGDADRLVFGFDAGGVQVYPDEELYKVEWDTGDEELNSSRYYRIFVFAAISSDPEFRLGFVDVNPYDKSNMKSAKTGDVFALKDGRTLPFKFRIEADWLCDPLSPYCAAEVITASDGGTVTAGTGDEVYVPPQDGGFPVAGGGTVDQITVTVDECSEPAVLPIDLPQYGGCVEVTAEPALDPLEPLPTAAIVAMCSAEDDDFGLTTDDQWRLLTMHRWDDQGTGEVYALSHAYYECSTVGMDVGSNGLMRFARTGLRVLSDGLERVLAPTPLIASSPLVMHHGPAAPTGFFSKFRLALPATVEKVAGTDGQAAEVNDPVPVPPAAHVTDLLGGDVEGALVQFAVISGHGSIAAAVGPPVPTGADGIATLTSWTLGPYVGLNQVRAFGRGFADEENNGPRDGIDPFQPLDDDFDLDVTELGPPVQLFTGDAVFSAGSVVEEQLPDCEVTGCTQEIVNADTGGVVPIDGDLVDFPPQGEGGFKVVDPDNPEEVISVDNITVIADDCSNPDTLPMALPQYGPCRDIYTIPQLAEELTELATVAMCSLEGETGLSYGLSQDQWDLVTLHRWDDRGTGDIYALPHYEYVCNPIGSNPAGAQGIFGFAKQGLQAVRDQVARVLAPSPLYADRPVVMHHGPAAPTGFFSKFRLALPGEINFVDPDDAEPQTGVVDIPLPLAVEVKNGVYPVPGAAVTFEVTFGDGQVGSQIITVPTNGDGVAQTPLVPALDVNEITVGGFGLAAPGEGPYMPPQLPNPDPSQTPVMLGTGNVMFTVTGEEVALPGEWITFNRTVSGNTDVFVINPDGTVEDRLTNDPAIDAGPAWSPDGMQIAFQSRRESEPTTGDIWVMNADGSSPVNLTNDPATFQLTPTWSPDGVQIAFMNRTGGDQVFVMNNDGTGLAHVAGTPTADAGFPCWSPDGTKIAFSTSRDGNPEIYKMDSDGSNQTNLTNNAGFDLECAWSPDGSKIAFVSSRDGNLEIYTMNADGSNQTNLSNSPGVDRIGSWSPSGEFFVFDSDRHGGPSQIYVMNSDGTGVTRISFSEQAESGAEWGAAPQVPLVVPQTWLVDLETATLVGPPIPPETDLWFEAETPTLRYLTPFNGATMALFGTTPPGKSGCLGLTLSTDRIPMADLPTGTFVCVLTVEGNLSEVEILQQASPSPGEMTIGIRVFP